MIKFYDNFCIFFWMILVEMMMVKMTRMRMGDVDEFSDDVM